MRYPEPPPPATEHRTCTECNSPFLAVGWSPPDIVCGDCADRLRNRARQSDEAAALTACLLPPRRKRSDTRRTECRVCEGTGMVEAGEVCGACRGRGSFARATQ